VAGAQLGNRIDAESVPLPNFANQNPELIADIERELQTRNVMPQEGDVNVTKPGAVRVVNATGTEIASDANAIAAQQPGVQEAPKQGYTSALNEEINSTPAPNTTVPITKPEEEKPAEEEGEQQPSSMLRTGIENKFQQQFTSGAEA